MAWFPTHLEESDVKRNHDYALRLFWALFDRMHRDCEKNRTRFVLALLAGRSHAEAPSNLSAQFQEFFRQRLAEGAKDRSIEVIDIASALRERFRRDRLRMFYPNDGHLNPEGHQVIARISVQEAQRSRY